MMSFRGLSSGAKMMSNERKQTILKSHLTTKVNKAEELTHLSINIAENAKLIKREVDRMAS